MLTDPKTISSSAAGSDVTFQDRIVAANGTGTAVAGEGNAIKKVDCSTLTCSVLDMGPTPLAKGTIAATGTVISTPSITISGAISDTLLADNIWSKDGVAIDSIGRNFTHQVPGLISRRAGIRTGLSTRSCSPTARR